ncbi:EamA family transporter RarD [Psychromonas sp. 14N.309.X.WAT.B.A12]|uniref:EamA family transporter RarD n=1 Tax=Psychromonas sp. 14N.309.X.WAT.B.A12 TaxID=2998322 RepID=UPI0025B20019|nr:EamA family transporter RarD [Psychromonas sp. 14N.309.X.WAT.B.A12]MDN2663955.1 EamA family transporter RarD [Psychromonas sp. 14N.309.X.WAT.B.A12]
MNKLSETQIGVLYALSAYFIWGIAPLYFKYLDFISVYEILSHRVIWSVVVTALLVSYLKDWPNVLSVCRQYKSLLMLVVTSLLISCNWLVFIWAINNGKMLEASLGYFINPIVNVVLGLVFLSERLSRLKWFAVFLAFIGVSAQAWQLGELPWVSLVLPFTFALYGLLRKKVKVKAITGLFLETLVVLPIAMIYLLTVAHSETSNLFNNEWSLNVFLMLAGVVTALPLICFGQAALRLPLSTLGFFQYLGPSLMFILAVFLYKEPVSLIKLFTFACIWTGILVFVFENKITRWLK